MKSIFELELCSWLITMPSNLPAIEPALNFNEFETYFLKSSEDLTPNGSLRRRRSRVPSEEDDTSLMDYLRTSGHADGSRERKSTGNICNHF